MLTNHRLTKDIYPTNYLLNLRPNFNDFTFNGEVQIQTTFDIDIDVDKFALHSKNLVIDSIEVDNNKCNFTEDKENEILIVNTNTFINKDNPSLTSGNHVIVIKYNGVLNDNMEGFYRSTYKDTKTGETKYLATTQFESTYARQAFPCFDEPNFKATFDVVITAPTHMTVLSNNVVKYEMKVDDESNMKVVAFETSPKMSTYLLAFIVGDLEYIEGTVLNKLVRVYGTPGNRDRMQYALNVTMKGLEWFINWFNIDYPLSKLDIVAVPDFSAGAMENWGLITFREGLVYCDQDTDLTEKQDIAVTICHELAHQWFGNLVTMEWWTYLWLNESMATYFGWEVADAIFPEWNLWDKFVGDEYAQALELDSLETSHPIEVPVNHANEIQNIFDAISYSKGSCLVRFLVNYLGEETFQSGMRKYMNDNKYKNTESDDLWKAFTAVSGKDIGELMNPWTKQMGYPVVTIDYDGFAIHFNQQKFLSQGINSENKNDHSLWTVPFDIKYRQKPDMNDLDQDPFQVSKPFVLDKKSYVLDRKDNVYDLTTAQIGGIYVNPDRTSFMRVKYSTLPFVMDDDEKYHTKIINTSTSILDDCFALAFAGYDSFAKPFDVLKRVNIGNIDNFAFWNTLIMHINMLDSLVENNEKITKIIQGICAILEKLLNKLGIENIESSDIKVNESLNDYDLRELILKTLVKYDNKTIINKCLELYASNKWQSKKYIVLEAVGKYGTDEQYNHLLKIYMETTNSQLRDALKNGLCNVRDSNKIHKSVDLVFSGVIRNQDTISYMRSLLVNKYSRSYMRSYIYNNWNKFLAIYPQGSTPLLSLIKILGIGYNTQEGLNQYKQFFTQNGIPVGANSAYDQTLERINNKIKMVERITTDPVFV